MWFLEYHMKYHTPMASPFSKTDKYFLKAYLFYFTITNPAYELSASQFNNKLSVIIQQSSQRLHSKSSALPCLQSQCELP